MASPYNLNDIPILPPIEPGKAFNPQPEWKKALAAHVDELQAMGGGLAGMLGTAVGSPGLQQYGQEVFNRNMEESTSGWQAPAVPRIEDVKLGEPGGVGRAWDFGVYNAVKGVATAAEALAGGVVGGGIKAGLGTAANVAAKDVLKAGIGEAVGGQIVNKAAKDVAKDHLATQFGRGMLAGTMGVNTGMESSQAFGSMVQGGVKPEDALGPALGYGAAASAVEWGPEAALAHSAGWIKLFKDRVRQEIVGNKDLAAKATELAQKSLARKALGVGGKVIKGAAIGAGMEGPQEGVQQLLQIAAERIAKDDPVFAALSDEQKSSVWNSIAGGMAAGLFMGGAVGPFAGRPQEQATAETPKASTQTPSTPPPPPATDIGNQTWIPKEDQPLPEGWRLGAPPPKEGQIIEGEVIRDPALAGPGRFLEGPSGMLQGPQDPTTPLLLGPSVVPAIEPSTSTNRIEVSPGAKAAAPTTEATQEAAGAPRVPRDFSLGDILREAEESQRNLDRIGTQADEIGKALEGPAQQPPLPDLGLGGILRDAEKSQQNLDSIGAGLDIAGRNLHPDVGIPEIGNIIKEAEGSLRRLDEIDRQLTSADIPRSELGQILEEAQGIIGNLDKIEGTLGEVEKGLPQVQKVPLGQLRQQIAGKTQQYRERLGGQNATTTQEQPRGGQALGTAGTSAPAVAPPQYWADKPFVASQRKQLGQGGKESGLFYGTHIQGGTVSAELPTQGPGVVWIEDLTGNEGDASGAPLADFAEAHGLVEEGMDTPDMDKAGLEYLKQNGVQIAHFYDSEDPSKVVSVDLRGLSNAQQEPSPAPIHGGDSALASIRKEGGSGTEGGTRVQPGRPEGTEEAPTADRGRGEELTTQKANPAVLAWAQKKFGTLVASNGKSVFDNFLRWFGLSKVVDEQGIPLEVYHGTPYGKFSEWNASMRSARDRISNEIQNLREKISLSQEDKELIRLAEEDISDSYKDLQRLYHIEGNPRVWARYSVPDKAQHQKEVSLSEKKQRYARALIAQLTKGHEEVEKEIKKLQESLPERPPEESGDVFLSPYSNTDSGWVARGIYFSSSKEEAEEYSKFSSIGPSMKKAGIEKKPYVYRVFLRMENPVESEEQYATIDKLVAEKLKRFTTGGRTDPDAYARLFAVSRTEAAKELGFDGFIAKSTVGGKSKEYIVFSPEQVKSSEEGTEYKGDRDVFKSQGPSAEARSAAQVRQELDAEFGKPFMDRALASGLLRIVDGPSRDGRSAEFSPTTGTITIYAWSQPKGTSAAVALHEGSHAGLRAMLGDAMDQFAKEIAKAKTKTAEAARHNAKLGALEWAAGQLRIPHRLYDLGGAAQKVEALRVQDEIDARLKKMSPADKAKFEARQREVGVEELLAYYVEIARANGTEGGLFRRIMNALKAAWVRTVIGRAFGAMGLRPKLSDGLMVALARQATERALKVREGMRELGLGGEKGKGGSSLASHRVPLSALPTQSDSQRSTVQRISNFFGDDILVLINPTKSDIQKLQGREKLPVRFILGADGKVKAAWDGNLMLHGEVASALQQKGFKHDDLFPAGKATPQEYEDKWGVIEGQGGIGLASHRTDVEDHPLWRSPLLDAIQGVKQQKASAGQWLNMLTREEGGKRVGKLPGVKSEEMDDIGFVDWLEAQQGVVDKEMLERFVREHGIKVEEVINKDTDYLRDENGQPIDDGAGGLVRQAGVQTKFAQYQVPGGQNYRELLVTIPGGEYQSGHWVEKGVLVHLRFNERTDADGRRVLFVEEVQSDWHQEGRNRGYKPKNEEALRAEKKGIEGQIKEATMHYQRGMLTRDEFEEITNPLEKRIDEILNTLPGDMPNAPMKQTSTWAMLGMKRAIKWAADHGFDRVAWTPGEVQAERYSEDNGGPRDQKRRKGMEGFYDKMLPNEVGKWAKKFGGRVGTTEIEGRPMWSLDLTPQMQAEADRGMTLYSRRTDVQWEDGVAGLSPERVDNLLKQYGYTIPRRIKESKAYLAWVDPAKFLAATTGSAEDASWIAADAGELDVEKLQKETQTPFLQLDDNNNIVNHEGRHRMAALARAGITKVAIVVEPAKNVVDPVGMLFLGGQDFRTAGQGVGLIAQRLIPISVENKEELNRVFGEKSIRQKDLLYSRRVDHFPEMIEVGGIQRPTLNNMGRPIHPTLEGVRNFWRWFGDSKMVDLHGQPIVFYHGTQYTGDVLHPGGMSEVKYYLLRTSAPLRLRESGEIYGKHGSSGPGIWLTDTIPNGFATNSASHFDVGAAGSRLLSGLSDIFARLGKSATNEDIFNAMSEKMRSDASKIIYGIQGGVAEQNLKPGDIYKSGRWIDERIRDAVQNYLDSESAPNILPLYVRMENPLSIGTEDARQLMNEIIPGVEGLGLPEVLSVKTRDYLRANGNDGIDVNIPGRGLREVIVFSPNQVKSAIGNSGAFSVNDPSVLASFGAIRDFQDQFIDWFRGEQPTDLGVRQRTHQWLQDKLAALLGIEKAQGVATDQSIYGMENKVRSKIMDRVEKLHLDMVEPMLKIAAENKWTMKVLNQVAYARTAEEVNQWGRRRTAMIWLNKFKNGMTDKAQQKQLEADIAAVRKATQTPVTLSNGKVVQRVDKMARQMGMYALLKTWEAKERDDIQTYVEGGGSQPGVPGSTTIPTKLLVEFHEFDQRPSGMEDADARAELAKWANNAEMQRLFAIFDDMTKKSAADLLAHGNISQEMYDRWMNSYQHYATLRRMGYEKGQGKGAGHSPARSSMLREFSPKLAVDVFANTIATMERYVVLQENNDLMSAFAKLIEQKLVPGGYEEFSVTREGKAPYIDRDGFLEEGPTKAVKLAENEALFFRDGVRYIIRAKHDNQEAMSVIQAMNNMDSPELGPVLKMFAKGTRFMAQLNTSLSPEFFFTNQIRDFLESNINMGDSEADKLRGQIVKELPKVWKALREVYRGRTTGKGVTEQQGARDVWGNSMIDWIRRYEAAGVPSSWMAYYEKAEDHRKDLDRRIKEMSADPSPHKTLHTIASFIEDYNKVAENAIRLATFKKLVESGVSDAKAATIAKELTVNFDRRGNGGVAINSLFMFANAGIQGSARMLRALATNRKVQKIAVGIVVASILVDLMNGSDDDWDKVPESVKARNLVFLNPTGVGPKFVTLPAPWGYNVVWGIGRRIGEMLRGKPGWTPAGAATATIKDMLHAFNPIEGGTWAQTITPTLLRPLVMIGENKNWTGEMPLRPEPFPGQEKPDSQLYWSTTSATSKWVAENVNGLFGGDRVTSSGWPDISPTTLDVWFGSMFGALGKTMRDTFELPKMILDPATELEVSKVPVLRKFTTSATSRLDAAMYHDRAAQVMGAAQRLGQYEDGPNRDLAKARDLRESERTLLGLAPAVKDAERQLKSLRQRVALAEARGDDGRVGELRAQMRAVRERFNQVWERRVNQ